MLREQRCGEANKTGIQLLPCKYISEYHKAFSLLFHFSLHFSFKGILSNLKYVSSSCYRKVDSTQELGKAQNMSSPRYLVCWQDMNSLRLFKDSLDKFPLFRFQDTVKSNVRIKIATIMGTMILFCVICFRPSSPFRSSLLYLYHPNFSPFVAETKDLWLQIYISFRILFEFLFFGKLPLPSSHHTFSLAP